MSCIRKFQHRWPSWAFAAALLSGCALGTPEKEIVRECLLPNDQVGSLTGRWKVTAVPIALQQGVFSPEETRAIVAAADTWNAFYASSLGLAALDYGDAANPRTSTAQKPANLCAQGILDGTKYKGSIVIYKRSTWTFDKDAIAVTDNCKSSGTPLPFFFMATLELNYQNFFSSGRKKPDLESIVLHEFGHVMGLDHSCEKNPPNGIPNCATPGLNQEYLTASMYPSFGFDAYGLGEEKRALNKNDQGRANCLYKDAVQQ